MNDFYVYFSTHDYIKEFRHLLDYVPTAEYWPDELQRMPQNEFGKLRLHGVTSIRLLYDNGHDAKCPWCACEQPIIKRDHKPRTQFEDEVFIYFYPECPRCLARGPEVRVNKHGSDNSGVLEHIKSFVHARWSNKAKKTIPQEALQ